VSSLFTGRRGVSMPFSDFCQPLVFNRSTDEDELFEALLELGLERKWSYFEVRGGRGSLSRAAVAAERFYGHKLDLTAGADDVFARFENSVGRAIRKAQKSGLTVEVNKTRAGMKDFYRLHARTRRRHGLPPQPFSFFTNIQKEIIESGLGFIVLAKYCATPVAAAVFFYSGEKGLFKFGASDERAQLLRGNNFVMWEGIKHLISKGLKSVHFGRTSMTNSGLRQFKLSWGTEEEVIEYFRFAINPKTWLNTPRNASEFHNHVFRKLPLIANRMAGALIYPHLD
jgi:Acetyltransferase (GNAT) domain